MQTVQMLSNQLILLQVKVEVLMPWRLFKGGVLWDPLEGIVRGMMSLGAIELLFKMQEKRRYRSMNLKPKRK